MAALPLPYDGLDRKTRDEVRWLADQIRTGMQQWAEGAVEIGQKLLEAKQAIPHGHFGAWLKAEELPISERTAQQWMLVATHFKSETVAQLPIPLSAFPMLLAAPPDLKDEIIQEAKNGRRITRREIKARVSSARRPFPRIVQDQMAPGLARRAVAAAVNGEAREMPAAASKPSSSKQPKRRSEAERAGDGRMSSPVFGPEHMAREFRAMGIALSRRRMKSFVQTMRELAALLPAKSGETADPDRHVQQAAGD